MLSNQSVDRRRMFQAAAASVAAASVLSQPKLASALDATASQAASETGSATLKKNAVVLFQGDSITDAGRDRKNQSANSPRSLGRGYPLLIAAELLRDQASQNLQIYNRGISGHKVPDLAKRWQADCIDLKPDVLSILVGVNDIWHKLNGRYDGTVEDYETGYTELIKETQSKLPDTRIVICEPFVLRCGAVKDNWFPEFTERLEVARQVASNLSLERVAFQDMFDEAIKIAEPSYWAGDGVHPTVAGHALMAKTWRETLNI